MIKIRLIIIVLFLFSFKAQGVNRLSKVTPYYSGNDLFLELVASFNMGTPWQCPDMVALDTFYIGDSVHIRAYYDVSGVWPANFCNSIDTVNFGQLPASLKMIRLEMYTVMFVPVDNDTDTVYCPQPWILWLPLDVLKPLPANGLQILPNPNNGQFFVSGNLHGILKMEVINTTGQAVYTAKPVEPGNFDREINLGNLPPGLYMLRFHTDKGVDIQKFVVE